MNGLSVSSNVFSASESPANKMILIPGNSFIMGAEGWGPGESPVHPVYLEAYWIDEVPVVNADFHTFVEDSGYQTYAEQHGGAWGYRQGKYSFIPGLSWKSYATEERADHPVVLVSWYDAQAFAIWAGKRLPTEAEWECAARGGLNQALYPWGDEDPDGSQCNFANVPADVPPTAPVRAYQPNGFGLYDMVGNIWQWCQDWYQEDYYRDSASPNPQGPESGLYKVRRGGSWNVIQTFRLRNANRGAFDPAATAPNVGFRCAASASRGTGGELSGSSDIARMKEVKAALEEVLPAMQADGGGAEIVSIAGNEVAVRMSGTCLICPSINLTIKLGIEKQLKARLNWVEKVVRVD